MPPFRGRSCPVAGAVGPPVDLLTAPGAGCPAVIAKALVPSETVDATSAAIGTGES
jgi:hypothetical protein